jgi:hypothetical protein
MGCPLLISSATSRNDSSSQPDCQLHAEAPAAQASELLSGDFDVLSGDFDGLSDEFDGLSGEFDVLPGEFEAESLCPGCLGSELEE